MNFTGTEAKAKIGKRIRILDNSLCIYEIARGTTGEVIGVESSGTYEQGVGQVGTIGGKKDEGWAVAVQFDASHGESTYPIEKDQYEESLEEI